MLQIARLKLRSYDLSLSQPFDYGLFSNARSSGARQKRERNGDRSSEVDFLMKLEIRITLQSLTKPDAMEQVLESRVGAQRIEAWPQQDGWVKSLLISLFEQRHRFVLFAQTYIDQGNLGGI